jgi:hypothetical protein
MATIGETIIFDKDNIPDDLKDKYLSYEIIYRGEIEMISALKVRLMRRALLKYFTRIANKITRIKRAN